MVISIETRQITFVQCLTTIIGRVAPGYPMHVSCGSEEDHFTAFRRRLPGLNFATFRAEILIAPPVLGFRPVLAFLFATEKVPNPGRVSLSPFFNAFVTQSVKALTAFSAVAFEILASFAMPAIKSAFVI